MSSSSFSGRLLIEPGPNGTKIMKPPERFTLGIRESEPTLCPTPESSGLLDWAGVSQSFTELTRIPQDLGSALQLLQLPNHADIAAHCHNRASELLSRGVSAGACTGEDLAVILAYLYEPDADDELTPFRALTESLTCKRSRTALRNVCEFLYLLVRSFHKLPKYRPEGGQLYCAVRGADVLIEADPARPRMVPYAVPNKKVWLPFVSTSTRYEVVKEYLNTPSKSTPGEMVPEGTIFVIRGKNTWGYDVSSFSDYPDEAEVVLEPERRMLVSEPPTVDGIVNVVTVEMDDTPCIPETFTPKAAMASYVPPSSPTGAAAPMASPVTAQMQPPSAAQMTSASTVGSLLSSSPIAAPSHQKTGSLSSSALATSSNTSPLTSSQGAKKVDQSSSSSNKKIKIKEVPEGFACSDVTCTGLKLSWKAVPIAGKEVNYQVEMKKKGLFNRNNELVYEGPNTHVEKVGLEPETEYEFQVRLGYEGVWGRWSDKIDTVTIKYPDDIHQESSTWSTVSLAWMPIPTRLGKTVLYHVAKNIGNNKFTSVYEGKEPFCTVDRLLPDTHYTFRVRSSCDGDKFSGWSKKVNTKTEKTSGYTDAWASCPDTVDDKRKYCVEESFVASKINENHLCTILGAKPIAIGSPVSWAIRILMSRQNNSKYFYIGVAPSDLDQNDGYNLKRDGWYFHCFTSTLWSGPPHYYRDYPYNITKKNPTPPHIGNKDDVGVVLDTSSKTTGVLSYLHNGANLGIAFEGIPLDCPLVPSVILYWLDDKIELTH